jgi:hypothetical protein
MGFFSITSLICVLSVKKVAWVNTQVYGLCGEGGDKVVSKLPAGCLYVLEGWGGGRVQLQAVSVHI